MQGMSAGALLLPPALERRLERLGLEFLAEFLGRASVARPDDIEILMELATLLTRLGRHEEGLLADERLARLAPEDPNVRYNLACSLALLGRLDVALDALEKAFELGYRDAEHLAMDEDLANLRREPRFAALLDRLRATSE